MKEEQIQIGLRAESRMGFGWISVKQSEDTGLNQGGQRYRRIGSGDDPRVDYVGIDTESRMD